MVLFAKLIRTIVQAGKRLASRRGNSLYRPEKHYMRGAGPKSKRASTAGGSTPKAT